MTGMEAINLSTLAKHFSDETAAWELVEKMRWPNGPVCPHCGETNNAYFINRKNNATRTGQVSYRRLWKCASCKRQFSVLVGSIFEDSKVPLSKWLLAIYMMCADKNGVAACELQRTLGVSKKTAWFINHRIREAMKAGPLADMFRGTIVADETWIGGEPRFRHGAKAESTTPVRIVPGHGNVHTDKTAVLSLINAETGEVRSRVVPDVTGATLRKVIAEHVDTAGSVLYTDKSKSYIGVGREFLAHEAVDHEAGEYVRYEDGKTITSNQAENFFSQLKRSIDGTHHHVSVEHLPRYLAEFDYRHSTRTMSDTARMRDLMARTGGRRLTYRSVAS